MNINNESLKKNSVGILLVNLGTPDAPTKKAVKKYLAEFLSDPRVIELPRWLWWPILHGVVLNVRPSKSAKLYQKIWTPDGSPLLAISKKQAESLEKLLQQHFHSNITVALGMSYGNPSITSALEILQKADVEKIIILPLYPQYSSSTTGSVFDAVTNVLRTWRVIPELSFINEYSKNETYISAIADSIKTFWQHHPRGDKLLFSFHGLPKNSIKKRDPYYFSCLTTGQLVAEKLQLELDQWQVVFQSRFGLQEWLQPYCDKTLQQLAKQGIKNIDLVCPGFAADCLETLEEIAIRNKEIFIEAGGEQLQYIPALNDSSAHIEALLNVIENIL